MKKCLRCDAEHQIKSYYCSKTCQKTDWKRHKSLYHSQTSYQTSGRVKKVLAELDSGFEDKQRSLTSFDSLKKVDCRSRTDGDDKVENQNQHSLS